jgi:hypothetical protein
MNRALILIATLAVGPLCAMPPEDAGPLGPAQRIAIEKAVLAADDGATAAGQDRDADRLLRYMLPNEKGSVVMNGNLLLTPEDAKRNVAESFGRLSSVQYKWKQRLVNVVSKDVAVVVSDGESIVTTTAGATFTTPFVQTAVWMLRDGAWKILHAHQSSPRR